MTLDLIRGGLAGTIFLAGVLLGRHLFGGQMHRHTFLDINREYIPPRAHFEFAGGWSLPPDYDELMNGCTIITQRCECGKYRQSRLIGNVPE